ncbi:hypothetical protein M378DRAFT_165432 [Amanita muscaria Koide BX008]|uniref:Uncharacterized protein n=1 Tax=Amanita muscaria (strain Koide BX008) TaxID=946122 RepID=A0A0C2X0U0_AMAMK|nr:hypothetical protein M378DRAFT_165432 [Amanita muscaria Koide BX008]
MALGYSKYRHFRSSLEEVDIVTSATITRLFKSVCATSPAQRRIAPLTSQLTRNRSWHLNLALIVGLGHALGADRWTTVIRYHPTELCYNFFRSDVSGILRDPYDFLPSVLLITSQVNDVYSLHECMSLRRLRRAIENSFYFDGVIFQA